MIPLVTRQLGQVGQAGVVLYDGSLVAPDLLGVAPGPRVCSVYSIHPVPGTEVVITGGGGHFRHRATARPSSVLGSQELFQLISDERHDVFILLLCEPITMFRHHIAPVGGLQVPGRGRAQLNKWLVGNHIASLLPTA